MSDRLFVYHKPKKEKKAKHHREGNLRTHPLVVSHSKNRFGHKMRKGPG